MKVLAVDDDKFNLSVVNKLLQEVNGISEIVLCHESEKAILIIEEKNIDILILDLIMPNITGFDILKTLRDNHKFDDMQIIMFTSLNDTDSFKRCFELGADDYINKPINVIEFKARIKAAIKSKANSNYLKELIQYTQKQNTELKETNAKLSDTKFHLIQAEKMAAIGQLAAGIAHEINNPMGFVNSNYVVLLKYFNRLKEYLDFIDNRFKNIPIDPNSELGHAAEEVKIKYQKLKIEVIMSELDGVLSDSVSGIKRVTDIIQSLRVFARSVKDDEMDTYSLLDLVNQVILITKNEVKYVSQIKIDIPDNIMIYCNKVQIGQVLINIIVNAAQAIQSQKRSDLGNIEITGEKQGDYINIIIKDDGPGIPEEYLTKIFEPFFTTKEIGKGTGLGLSISYDIIVNKHKGSIDIQSELGKGSAFIIKLPDSIDIN